MSKEEIALLKRALDRQIQARKQAEKILEDKSRALYGVQHYLTEENNRLNALLKEKVSEMEGAFFSIPDPYLVMNLEGKIIKMNVAAKEFLGYDLDQKYFYAAQLVHHAYLENTMQSFQVLQEVGVLKNFKTKVYLKNGDCKSVQITANLIYDRKGNAIAAQGVLRDISNEAAVSELLEDQKIKLQDSQSRLTAVVYNLQFGVLLEDEHRNIALTNKVFCDMFGIAVAPDDMIGTDCSNAAEESKLFFKDPEGFVSRIETLLKERKTVLADELYTVTGVILQRDFIPIFNGDLYKGHLWVYTDVTQRKKYKETLKIQKEKYSSIIANMNLGLAEVDNNDCVQLVNKSFCKLTGYTEKELMGARLSDFLAVSDPSIIEEHQRKRLQGISDTYEVSIKNKDGRQRRWLISGAPRYDPNGKIVGSIGIHLDITQKHEMNVQKEVLLKQLEASNAGLKEYAHVVSHDLKSPLRSISALASWLEEDFGAQLGDQGLSQLSLMQDKIAAMDALITGILKYSSIGMEQHIVSKIAVGPLLEKIKNTLYWPTHITLEYPKNIPEVQADATQLLQLFQNLIGNAIVHIDKPKGLVKIGYKDLGAFWEFSVTDNGVGIDKAYYKKIFEIFQSVSNRNKTSGIGLSIVKKIVHLHSGRIWVESKLGQGTTFYFTLKKLSHK